ncbi:hypothetical protein [Paenibacillus glacialis]|uniref:Uncharacterized protein n=1 Tax=Paenibacillus glacialis TaxID=494026 RepID=A0A168MJ87_9BACL|nr:hypothetical protein [Paenibacillus glacialis]OAB44744.1 hypothetical protein PGLA_04840 [Paenibacillus glacialis]
MQGKNQSIVSAKVTAAVAKIIYDSSLPSSVHHIEQVMDLAYIQKELGTALSLDTRITVPPQQGSSIHLNFFYGNMNHLI